MVLCIIDNCVIVGLLHYCDILSLYITLVQNDISYRPLDQREECWNILMVKMREETENGEIE